MTSPAQPSGSSTVLSMLGFLRAAFFNWATLLGLVTGISGVTVLTLVQGRTRWWVFALVGGGFLAIVLVDALRRAVLAAAGASAAASAAESQRIVVHRAIGGHGGDGGIGGGVGGAGGSNYIGTFGRN